MKTFVFSTQFYESVQLSACNKGVHELTFFEQRLEPGTMQLASGAEALSVSIHDRIDSAMMKKLSGMGIKAIVLRCAGYDNVDINAAHQYNIKVLNVPAYSPQAVAEHAVALVMALNRKTCKAYNRTRTNNFDLAHLMGFDLFGKTVGVVGTGKIGSAFCNIMLGFGCKVLAFDLVESEALKAKGVTYCSFDTLLAASDVISIHCPLNDDTYHLFDKHSYAKMKPGTMLINTARGAIVNTLDTLSALKDGQLGYLGIDVYEWETGIFHSDWSEKIVKDDFLEILLSYSNVLVTPHQAFFTKEAVVQISETTIKNLTDVQNNKPLANEVKPKTQHDFY